LKNITLTAILFIGIIGCIFYYVQQRSLPANSLIDKKILSSLPQMEESKIDTSHLAKGLIPPTNKWFTGVVLQKTPKTIFSTPLALSATETSFSFSLPRVTSSKNTITNNIQDSLSVHVESATHYIVTRYDELSVDLTFKSESQSIGTLTLMAGSPYVQFTSLQEARISLTTHSNKATLIRSNVTFTTPTQRFFAAGYNGVSFSKSDREVAAKMTAGGLVTMYSLPTQQSQDVLMAHAGTRILGANVNYEKHGDQYKTEIAIKTANNQPTVFGLLSHQVSTAKASWEYSTIYGKQRMIDGQRFAYTTPRIDIKDRLNLSKISDEEKKLLITSLRREINATKFTATDTYFSGKELYRSAQLLELAKQLNQMDIASTIQMKLRQEIIRWLSPSHGSSEKFFYYDSKMHSIVGVQTSFGSEQINDHHFHYGYFIYAASILAKYDAEFLKDYEPMVNLLVADIANYNLNTQFPIRRVFDPYFGHSWASGSAPFNDGNNQESVSEALNAWIGVSIWATQTKNKALKNEADWMLSLEANSANTYWMNISTSLPANDNQYLHTIVPLNWGGKRDYSTFFSAEPNAQLGILLIPMSPTMISELSYGNDVINAHIKEAVSIDYNVQFGDYILMYSALADTKGRLEQARNLPEEFIDSANSRSYMMAWILSVSE
jgi:endo-1,3(4)-beta-glucanase